MAGVPMIVDTMWALGAVLRGRRTDLGLSQSAVAARARVSRQFVGDAEAGKPTMEVGRLLALIQALDLQVDLRSAQAPVVAPGSGADEPDLDDLLDAYLAGDQ